VADDDFALQITTPILHTFVVPRPSYRTVSRIRGLYDVSRVARAAHEIMALEPAETAPAVSTPAPRTESHERLTPETAATLSQLHAVEGELMVRAMIEAAKADGKIDAEERRRILTCLRDADAPEADRRTLLAALDQPPDLDALVARVTNPELAVEVYAASLLAIKDDKPSEQRYLARLAQRLQLPPETVAALHARFGDPPPLAPEA
jgi:uncharacterized membrane protein YebE (DUF533 family)